MSKVLARVAREPVMLGELIKSALTLGVSFGLKLTTDQAVALYGFVSLTGAFIVRMFVSPGGRDEIPKDPPTDDPPSTRPSGRPPLIPAAMLALSMLLSPCLVGCSSPQSPQAQAVEVRDAVRAGYGATRLALVILSNVHATWAKSRVEPTRAEVEASAKAIEAFEASKRALEAVRPWLEEGDGGSQQKEKLLEALDMALVAVASLQGVGVSIPVEVVEGLHAAHLLIGGDS